MPSVNDAPMAQKILGSVQHLHAVAQIQLRGGLQEMNLTALRQQIHARGQGGIVPSVLQSRRGRISDPVYLTAILCKASQFFSGFKVDHGHTRNNDGVEGIVLIT